MQVIPHVTDEIKRAFRKVSEGVDVVIVEIGGTVGDIESLPFLEAIRQMRLELGPENTIFVHVTLVPLHRHGGRTEDQADAAQRERDAEHRHPAGHPALPQRPPLPREMKAKIALFCNMRGVARDYGAGCEHDLRRAGGAGKEGLDEQILRR